VDERDLRPEQPRARPLVDQVHACGGEPIELGGDVVDTVGDVVQARPTAREEAADGRLGPERPEQLDPVAADAERARLDALVGHDVAVLDHGAEEQRVRLDRPVEVVDGDANVVDLEGGHDRRP
jgi:hypothetical protein